jgi:hypothetical protein
VGHKKLESTRRSLAMFLVNLVEIALYFTVILTLCGCYSDPSKNWNNVYQNIQSIFNLDLIDVQNSTCCIIFSHYELIVATTVMTIVIASLVGAVIREEKKEE